HTLPIPDDAAGKRIYFKIRSDYMLIGITSLVFIGSDYSLVKHIITSDFDNITIAIIAFFIGIFALMRFIANRKQWEYFFLFFCFVSGFIYYQLYVVA
ncbi:MAG: hypothetical protein ACUVRK_13460, partial [Spirochaetota bacterium]